MGPIRGAADGPQWRICTENCSRGRFRDMPDFQLVPDPNEIMGSGGADLMRAFLKTIKANPSAMILLTERLGYTHTAAYRMVYPERRCSDASAADYVRRLKLHHRKTYPLGINEALEVNGVTIEGVIEDIQAEREAMKYRWDQDKQTWVATSIPDYPTRRAARRELREWVNLEQKVRQELAVGKAEMQKMHLDTGMKFDTVQEWLESQKGRDEEILAERATAAREMRQIAQGRQIIQEEGQEKADEYRKAALDAGLTGDEADDE